MDFLEFHNITKSFGKKEVLRGVSFSLKKGEILGLAGNSGGGKSTLLNILVGIVFPDGGEIYFDNKNILKNPAFLRKKIGFATQKDMLFEELTLKENAFYFGSLYGSNLRSLKKKFRELIPLLGLEGFENSPVSSFSGGMVKRANFLISLIHDPEILILDEPTVGLDPLIKSVLWRYIKKVNTNGTTILVISHLLEELEENCDRIGLLKNGKILALAKVKDYFSKYGKKSFGEIYQELMK